MCQAEIGHTETLFQKTKGCEEENNNKKESPRLGSEVRGHSDQF